MVAVETNDGSPAVTSLKSPGYADVPTQTGPANELILNPQVSFMDSKDIIVLIRNIREGLSPKNAGGNTLARVFYVRSNIPYDENLLGENGTLLIKEMIDRVNVLLSYPGFNGKEPYRETLLTVSKFVFCLQALETKGNPSPLI